MRKSSGSSMPAMPALGLGLGTLNSCSADNDSFFCKFSRFFQMLVWVIIICAILYFIYSFAMPFIKKRKR